MLQQFHSFITTLPHSFDDRAQILLVVAAVYLGMGVALWTLHHTSLSRES